MKRLLALAVVFFVVRWESPSKPNQDIPIGSMMPAKIEWITCESLYRFSSAEKAEEWMKSRWWTEDRKRLKVRIVKVEETEMQK